MKKILIPVAAILVLMLTSCIEPVTPVGYTRFNAEGSQYVYYSADMYGLTEGQIEVYKDEAEFNDEFGIADLQFIFSPRCCGADNLDETSYVLVDLTRGTADMTVYLYKAAAIYDPSKKIYLNGTELVPDSTYDGETLVSLTFENLNFTRTNPNGRIDSAAVNVLEYK